MPTLQEYANGLFNPPSKGSTIGPSTAVGDAGVPPGQPTGGYTPPQGAMVPGTPNPNPIKPFTPPPGAGLNMMQPGAVEQQFEGNKGFFGQPTASEGFLRLNYEALNTPGMAQGFAQQTLGRLGGGPNVSANLDPFYDRAVQKSTNALNDQLAARGAYGSSVGLGQIGQSITDLRADQANREADYGLRRADLERGFAETLSGIARSSDQGELERILGGARVAEGTDSAALARVLGGMESAGMAQGAQRARGQDFFNNQFLAGNALSGVIGSNNDALLGTDAALLDSILGLNIGQGAQGVSNAARADAQSRDDTERTLDSLQSLASIIKSDRRA